MVKECQNTKEMKTGKKKIKKKKEKKLLVSNQFLILNSMDNKEIEKN